jgi:hypothetical protein
MSVKALLAAVGAVCDAAAGVIIDDPKPSYRLHNVESVALRAAWWSSATARLRQRSSLPPIKTPS